MTTEQFEREYAQKTAFAEKIVKQNLTAYLKEMQNEYVRTILDAMDYSVMAGGKRLRPLLMAEVFHVLAKGELAQTRMDSLAVFMTAMEMIHTYSLVHDDLPAMDNDAYRRGKETTWKVYGDAMGVLTGDALLNAAFELIFGQMAKCMEEQDGEQGRAHLKAIAECGRILSGKACVNGMLGGQVADVQAEKESLVMTQERILFIHTNKTAALIEAAMSIGAVLADADPEMISVVTKIARKVGIAFQIQDDILDVEGDSKELGKPVGSDEESGKETYVTLKGLEESHREVKRLSEEALEQLKLLPGDVSFLEKLIEYLIYRKK